MSDQIQLPSPTLPARGGSGPVEFVLSRLASLKFALTVVALIALACVVGTLIPQGPQQVAAYLERHPGATSGMNLLSLLGLTRVFYTWWFVGLLFVFAASLTVCTARRFSMIRRSAGVQRARVIGSFITHVGLLLVLAGGAVGVIWGQKGIIQLHEGESASQAEGQEGSMLLPFTVRLAKFALEYHENPAAPVGNDKLLVQWSAKKFRAEFPIDLKVEHPVIPPDAPAGAEPPFKVSVLRYVSDFSLDGSSGEVKSRSDKPNNPAVQVSVTGGGRTNTQWVFARFPDFSDHGGMADATDSMPLQFRFESAHAVVAAAGRQWSIKAFKSTLEVLEQGVVVDSRTIMVNSPYSRRGYTFYQVNYDPNDLTWSALQVVKDPGVPVVYGGFILIMVGLTVVFCVSPWLDAQRRTKGGIS